MEKGGIRGPQRGQKELTDLIEVLKKDHDVLVDQVQTLKCRNGHLEKVAADKEALFDTLKLEAEKAKSEMFKFKQEFDTVHGEKTIIENQVTILNEKLESETFERENVTTKEKKQDYELQQLRDNLHKFKTQYEDLGERKNVEVKSLNKEVDDLKLREREYRSKLEVQDQAIYDLEEDNRILKRDLAQTRGDCENMLNIMEENEKEISGYTKRQELIDQMGDTYRKKIEDTQLEADRVQLKEQQMQNKVIRLEEECRQIKIDLDEKYKKLLDNLKSKQKIILDERDSEITDLNNNFTKKSLEYEKIFSENESLRT